MTCNEAFRLIGPFVDDELDVRSAVDVEGHLARCAACAQEKSEITALRDTVRERLPRFDPPDGLEDRLFRATRVVALLAQVVAAVPHDAQEPRSRARGTGGLPRSKSSQHRFLQCVLGVGLGSRQPAGEIVRGGEVRP